MAHSDADNEKPQLLSLPIEILITILRFAFAPTPPNKPQASPSVLRVCRLLHTLGHPIFHSHLTLTISTLYALPAPPIISSCSSDKSTHFHLDLHSQSALSSTHRSLWSTHAALQSNLRTLKLDLDYFSSPLTGVAHASLLGLPSSTTLSQPPRTPSDQPLRASTTDALTAAAAAATATTGTASTPGSIPLHHLNFNCWTLALTSRIQALASYLPHCPRLTSLTLSATTSRNLLTRSRLGPRPFIDEATLISLFRHLGACKNLRVLEIDTADAEGSGWTPDAGVGCCHLHVCEALRTSLSQLARLEVLKVRRRDVCPRLLAFDGPVLKTLKSVEVDLRLLDAQRIAREEWAASSRSCGCRCWCSTCVARAVEMFQSATFVNHGSRESLAGVWVEGEGGVRVIKLGIIEEMKSAMTALAKKVGDREGGALDARLKFYERPWKCMCNRNRIPIHWDAVKGKGYEDADLGFI